MFKPHDIYEQLVTMGTEWADSNAAAEILEETKKTLIAELMADCDEKTWSAKENYALRQKKYLEHIEIMTMARKTSNRAKVKYDSTRVYADLLRTQNANERAANRSAP